jgi:hypothetical protein
METSSSFRLTKADLAQAVEAGIVDARQAEQLWSLLGRRDRADPRPRFDLIHLLWYAGALIIMAAMGLFTTEAWSRFGGAALAAVAVVYAVCFIAAGTYLWHARGLRTAGGLLIAVAVTMAPLAIYGVQDALDWWSHGDPGAYRDFFRWIKGSWLPMDIATIAAAVLALRFFRFPFIVMPLAIALWFLSMDLAPWLFGEPWADWEKRKLLSVGFGLVVLALAWLVDHRARGDFAFWLHLFGLLTFWGGLSAMDSDSEFNRAIYCALNVVLLLFAIFMRRRVYAVFGTLGIAGYLGHLSYTVFKDSLLFPFALSMIGIAIIVVGLLYFRKREAIEAWIAQAMPPVLRNLRPAHAAHR